MSLLQRNHLVKTHVPKMVLLPCLVKLMVTHTVSAATRITQTQILAGGDIESNPPPTVSDDKTLDPKPRKLTSKNPCISCEKGVTARSKAISCDCCERWTHRHCTYMAKLEYEYYAESEIDFSYICNHCLAQN